MQNTTHTLEPLRTALEQIGLADLLTTYVARERVGVRYTEIARAAEQFDLEFKHEGGNVYGALQLVPVSTTPAPALRLITRSDHAAQVSSKRAA